MSPHLRGNEALIFVILLCAPLAFGLCGALSVIPLLSQGRVARIAQRLATIGLILVHVIVLAATDEWVNTVMRARVPFFWMTPVGHALVLAGYLRLRSSKRAGSPGLT